MSPLHAKPTLVKERIVSLDILRGFALLGILLVNIYLFAQPTAAFSNPSVMGKLSASGYAAYCFVHVFAELKFMTIFSILFGAGIVLFVKGLNERGQDGIKLHTRRMMFLLLFGMFHAYLIWFGDILVSYAIIGLLALSFLNMKETWKMILIPLLYVIPMGIFYGIGSVLGTLPEEMAQEAIQEFSPTAEAIAAEIDLYRNGTWFAVFAKRASLNLNFQIGSFFMLSLWRTTAMMLLGMLLLKKGILSAQKSKLFYAAMAVAGIGTGSFLAHQGCHEMAASNWDMVNYFTSGYQYNYFGSVFSALGYIGALLLLYRLKTLQFLMKGFEAVGRLAFTNYLCQSIICSLIFYSYGFGMFGHFSRLELLFCVVPIWAFQVLFSCYWLQHYKMGPFEWLWRYLTYGQKPQFKKHVNN